jgi:addiction module HigA family antidote
VKVLTPGHVLREEFMLGLSVREPGVPSNRITAILAGHREVTAETAVLLSKRFGTSAGFWLNPGDARPGDRTAGHARP